MKSIFPEIRTIDDVWPFVKDDPRFIKVDKEGGYTVINYVVADEHTFPDDNELSSLIRRECRGIIFDTKTGKLLSRPFHKFFNVGERLSTQEHIIEALYSTLNYKVEEKLDGSMIRPVMLPDGSVRWMTKMGITDTGLACEEYLKGSGMFNRYTAYATECIKRGFTPIFEFTGPSNIHCVPYKDNSVTLLVARNNLLGDYPDLDFVNVYYGIPTVQEAKVPLKDEEGREGVVITFENGFKVKVKTEWHRLRHFARESALNERLVVKAILGNTIDDVISVLPEPTKGNITKFTTEFNDALLKFNNDVNAELSYTCYRLSLGFGSRKEFAEMVKGYGLKRNLFFRGFDTKGTIDRSEVVKLFERNLQSDTKYNQFKQALPDFNWPTFK